MSRNYIPTLPAIEHERYIFYARYQLAQATCHHHKFIIYALRFFTLKNEIQSFTGLPGDSMRYK